MGSEKLKGCNTSCWETPPGNRGIHQTPGEKNDLDLLEGKRRIMTETETWSHECGTDRNIVHRKKTLVQGNLPAEAPRGLLPPSVGVKPWKPMICTLMKVTTKNICHQTHNQWERPIWEFQRDGLTNLDNQIRQGLGFGEQNKTIMESLRQASKCYSN